LLISSSQWMINGFAIEWYAWTYQYYLVIVTIMRISPCVKSSWLPRTRTAVQWIYSILNEGPVKKKKKRTEKCGRIALFLYKQLPSGPLFSKGPVNCISGPAKKKLFVRITRNIHRYTSFVATSFKTLPDHNGHPSYLLETLLLALAIVFISKRNCKTLCPPPKISLSSPLMKSRALRQTGCLQMIFFTAIP